MNVQKTYQLTSLLFMNIRSIKNKIDDLKSLIQSFDSKIEHLLIAETWLTDDNIASLLPDYQMFATNRVAKRGGGVAIFTTKSNLNFQIFELKYLTPDIESVFVQTDKNKCIGCIYRPPSGNINNFLEKFEEILEFISHKGYQAYICGDFNINLKEKNSSSENLELIMLSYSFRNIVDSPTRVTLESETLIDLVITNDDSHIKNEVLKSDLSDHFPILTTFKENSLQINEKYTYRNYSEKNLTGFKLECNQLNWDEIYNEQNPDVAYDIFYTKLMSIYNKYFPDIQGNKIHKVNDLPWITKELKKSKKIKNKLFKKYLKSKDLLDLNIYKNHRNKLNREFRQAKIEYYNKTFISKDKKQIWIELNKLMHRTTQPNKIESIIKNDTVITDKGKLPDIFNEFFINVNDDTINPNTKILNDPLEYIKLSQPNSFSFIPTSPIEVQKVISRMKNKVSTGIDLIIIKPIKLISESLSYPLAFLINLSLEKGIFPNALKKALVKPIFKKGNEQLVSNYRPISILPVFSKIYESIISTQMTQYLEKFSLLYKKQYGFRVNKTTEMAILDLTERVKINLDNGETNIGIFLDIQKAFDTINHKLLLQKLDKYGFRGVVNDWIKSYLSNRYQSVEINNIRSVEKEIIKGVPQGSILGPLFFLVFINDLHNAVDEAPILFADDTNLLFHNIDLDTLINTTNNQLKGIDNWFSANLLKLNYEKTQMIIWSPHHQLDVNKLYIKDKIKISEVILNFVPNLTYLGIKIDEALNWQAHITYIIKKIAFILKIISQQKTLLPQIIRKQLYYALIYPHLIYGIVIWGDSNKKFINKLLLLQKRFLRILYDVGWYDAITIYFKKDNIFTINQLYHLHLGQIMFKLTKQNDNSQLSDLFLRKINSITRYNLNYLLPKINKETTKKILSFKGAKFWNSLPQSIKEINMFKQYKKLLRLYIEKYLS